MSIDEETKSMIVASGSCWFCELQVRHRLLLTTTSLQKYIRSNTLRKNTFVLPLFIDGKYVSSLF